MDLKTTNSERTTHAVAETVGRKRTSKVDVELQALKVEMIDPSVLKPNPYNPNKQDEEEFALLRRSIQKDGFTMPVLANIQYVIIDGEHRWRAAMAESLKSIPVVRIDVDEVRMKLSTIRHNKARGSHDANLEAMVIADLERLGGRQFLYEELMMKDADIDGVLNFLSAADSNAGEEFGSAWSPVSASDVYTVDEDNKPQASPNFVVRNTVDNAVVMRSSTTAANLLAYQKASGAEHVKKRDFYALHAQLPPEQAVVLKDHLESGALDGETPAERFVSLLQEIENV